MKHIHLPARKRQAGLSLIELMIALVLGLVVVSAVFNTFLGSSRSAQFSQGLQEMQENGRFGITTLQRGIRLAGYSPDGVLDEPFDILNSSDSELVVRTTDVYDCNGELTAGVGGVAINTYAHDAINDIITCTGNVVGTAMPVVEGVEEMRFLWGIDSDTNGIPESYIPYSAAINPSEVVAIRLAILVKTDQHIRTRAGEETHVLLDREITTDDKFARHVFTATVVATQQIRLRSLRN